MKHRLLSLMVILATTLSALAQATQPCIVKQYNQKQTKTPLPGVQVEVRDAGSATSDKAGQLTLKFATLKPGDRVTFRAATKAGFELMNKSAVEQWNITRNEKPFEIVLVKSDYFNQLKNNLKQASIDNYRKKYEQARAELEKLQKESKLREQEYRQKLNELEDHYDNQLKNLDTYVDQYARIDLSELSKQERHFIELAQAGRLDEAAEAYNRLDAAGKYATAVENVQKLNTDIKKLESKKARQQETANSLYAMLQRQVATLKLAGGEENFRKAGELLKRAALADTTNVYVVWKYAGFAHGQNDFDEAERFYQICNHHADIIYNKVAINHDLGVLYTKSKKYDKASKAYGDALDYLRQSGNLFYTLTLAAAIGCNYGSMCEDTHNYESAEDMYKMSLQYYRQLDSLTQGGYQVYIGRVYHNLGQVYRMRHRDQDDAEKAEKYYLQSLEIKEKILQENDGKDDQYREDVSITQNDLGLLYIERRQFSQAEHYLKKALKNDEYLCGHNRQAYQGSLAKAKMNLGHLYMGKKEFDMSLRYFKESLQIWETLYSHSKDVYRQEITETLYNMGIIYMNKGNWNGAEPLFLRLLSINPEELEWSMIISSPLLLPMFRGLRANSQYCLMLIYERNPQLNDKYRKYLGEALKSYKLILDKDPAYKTFYVDLKIREAYMFANDGKTDKAEASLDEAYEMDHVNTTIPMAHCLNNLAYLYMNAQDFPKAIETIDRAIAFIPGEANFYDTKGEILLVKGDTRNALKMWRKVLELEPDFLSKHEEGSVLYNKLKEKGLVK